MHDSLISLHALPQNKQSRSRCADLSTHHSHCTKAEHGCGVGSGVGRGDGALVDGTGAVGVVVVVALQPINRSPVTTKPASYAPTRIMTDSPLTTDSAARSRLVHEVP